MNVPITQSSEWQKLQQDLGETSFLKQGKDYIFLAILKSTPFGRYLYLPYGPVYNGEEGRKAALSTLDGLAHETNSFFVRVEPQSLDFAKNPPKNARKTTDLNPKETWTLDLTGSQEDLKSRLPSRLLRYHRNSTKNHLSIKTSHNPEDIHYLLDLQKTLAHEKGINTFSEHYLQTELSQPFSTLYLVEYDDPETKHTEVIAAGLVFDDKKTRYNLQGAQSERGRKLHATGILTIQLILDAKEKNLKTFDFWGIAPEGAPKTHPWSGFTAFKKTFAGQEVDYSGTYDIVMSQFRYSLYQVFRKLNRLIRKI